MRPGYRSGFVVFVTTFCALSGLASRASAGPVEQLVQLAIHPRDPNTMLVRYIYGGGGMLRTHDGGQTWQLACDSMQLDPQTRSGTSVIAGDGSTWMGVFDGLYHDDAHDCGWQREPSYDGEWFGDLTNHPTDPDVVFAVTSTASRMDEQVKNGVLRRDASGAWSDFGVKEEMLVTRLVVAAHGSGLRMYMSAVRGQTMPSDGGLPRPIYVIRVSDDEGATWQEFPVGDVDGTFRLQGVDPTNADRIVATIGRYPDAAGGGDDSVLVSSDRGATFTELMKVSEIGGVALAPDGRVWIGDLGGTTGSAQAPGGLWFAPSLDASATRLAMADYPVECLGYNPANDTLYACQKFAFGTVDKDSGAFSSLVKLRDVHDFVQCDGVDSAAACEMQLCGAYCGYGHFGSAPICQVYSGPGCGVEVAQAESAHTTLDAGTPPPQVAPVVQDAGTTSAASSSANLQETQVAGPRHKDTGCAVTELGAHDAPSALGFAAAMALLGLSRARRRAR